MTPCEMFPPVHKCDKTDLCQTSSKDWIYVSEAKVVVHQRKVASWLWHMRVPFHARTRQMMDLTPVRVADRKLDSVVGKTRAGLCSPS